MDKFQLYYPFKPFLVSQEWGVYNPAYEQLGFRLHNGIDCSPNWSYKTYPVFCPVEGFYVERVQYEPKGGGNEVFLRSKEPVELLGVGCYHRLILCHAEKVFLKAGYEPKLGELLMVGDNTGFSTGPHTHMGLYRLDKKGNKVDQNEATGSINPRLFFNDKYAYDHASTPTAIASMLRYYQYVLTGV